MKTGRAVLVLLLMGSAAHGAEKSVLVTPSRFTTSHLTNRQADSILAGSWRVLRVNHKPGDRPCPVRFIRAEGVTTFSTGDGSIDSFAELDAVEALPGGVKVVNQLNWCGRVSPNFLGCARIPSSSFTVVRISVMEDILWAHEYGHTRGLHHRNDRNAVMNPFLTPTMRKVTSAECAKFRSSSTGRTEDPATPAAPVDIRTFVSRLYIHGVPYEEASRFDAETTVPVLLAMLADPEEEQLWPNIVVTLGMIGDERAVEPLIEFLQQEVEGTLSHNHYIAKSSVVMSLGYVINRTGSRRALDFLVESADPETWSHRSLFWASPYHGTDAERDRQLATMSILGLGLSGHPEAAEVLRTLPGPADVIDTALEAHRHIERMGLGAYYREELGRPERQRN
ncbi:MAG TPA: hypothetical protein VN493_20235 [Thermoanaerobaculia bacterium]|nr:hypothetical protein [Thermoanaerobaculia bacterium]